MALQPYLEMLAFIHSVNIDFAAVVSIPVMHGFSVDLPLEELRPVGIRVTDECDSQSVS